MKTSKPRVTDLCEVTGEFPGPRASNAESETTWITTSQKIPHHTVAPLEATKMVTH